MPKFLPSSFCSSVSLHLLAAVGLIFWRDFTAVPIFPASRAIEVIEEPGHGDASSGTSGPSFISEVKLTLPSPVPLRPPLSPSPQETFVSPTPRSIPAPSRLRISKQAFDQAHPSRTTPAPPNSSARPIEPSSLAHDLRPAPSAKDFPRDSHAGQPGETADEVANYLVMLQQRLRQELDTQGGWEAGLRADAEIRLAPDGRLAQARIVRASPNDAFDRAVLAAIARIQMPPRPAGLEELLVIPFVASRAPGN